MPKTTPVPMVLREAAPEPVASIVLLPVGRCGHCANKRGEEVLFAGGFYGYGLFVVSLVKARVF